MKELDDRAVLNRRSKEFLVFRFVLLFLDFGGMVESFEKRCVGCGGLLCSLPELLLSGVAVHGADLQQAIAELLWRGVEVASFWADNRSIIDKTGRIQDETRVSSHKSND